MKVLIVKAPAWKLPLKDESIQLVVCSPPYWGLRAYDGDQGEKPFGQEPLVEGYVETTLRVFRELHRVLKPDGIVFWNVGDTFARDLPEGAVASTTHRRFVGKKRLLGGLKPKDLVLVPARVALAVQDSGWWLRADIIWCKTNCMPTSSKDRPADSYEHVFMFTKSPRYYWDREAAVEAAKRDKWGKALPKKWDGWGKLLDLSEQEANNEKPGPYRIKTLYRAPKEVRVIRDIWNIQLQPTKGGHPATFPEELVLRCIMMASKPGDVVLDPFGGSGTTAKVAIENGRNAVHSDLHYHDVALERIRRANVDELPRIIRRGI